MNIEEILHGAAREAMMPTLQKMAERLEEEARIALHLQVERMPPLSIGEAWDILMTYPCQDMPFLTRDYILALLQDQGIVHPMDLDRFLHTWKKEGKIQKHGTHIIFEPSVQAQDVTIPSSVNTPAPSPAKSNVGDLQEAILDALESSPYYFMSSRDLRLEVAPEMKADAFLQILRSLEREGCVNIEGVRGLPHNVTLRKRTLNKSK